MENLIYTIEEINVFVDILKNKFNMNFEFDNLSSDEIDKHRQYLYIVRKITHATRDNNILSKANLIDELNNEKIKYTDSGEENLHCIEVINEFINILNA